MERWSDRQRSHYRSSRSQLLSSADFRDGQISCSPTHLLILIQFRCIQLYHYTFVEFDSMSSNSDSDHSAEMLRRAQQSKQQKKAASAAAQKADQPAASKPRKQQQEAAKQQSN